MKTALLCLALLASPAAFADEAAPPLMLAANAEPAPAAKPKATVEKRIFITRVGEDGVELAPIPPLPPIPPMPEMIQLHAGHGMALDDAGTAGFIDQEFGPHGGVVKNAPFSAEASSEKVQILADGNRIVRKLNNRLYRDSQGRKRYELLAEDGSVRNVFIYDPVAGVHYSLDPARKTATKLNMPALPDMPQVMRFSSQSDGKPLKIERNVMIIRDGKANETRIESGNEAEADSKSLGSRDIEGIKAEGNQSSRVIPAGKIGNEKPIQIVTERWYAPELKLVLATTTRDPRAGEVSYKLSKIKRAEPDSGLFKPPADYKVTDIMAHLPKPPAPPAPPAPPKPPKN